MKEKLQLTPQKYKGLPEATMKKYMLYVNKMDNPRETDEVLKMYNF